MSSEANESKSVSNANANVYANTGEGSATSVDKFMLPAAAIPKLDGKNYQSWMEMVTIVLELKNLSNAIHYDNVDATANLHAKLILLGAMDESHRSQVRGCTTAKAIVDRLKLIYADQSAANIYRLLMQYYRYDKKPEDSISVHIGKMDEMRRQLADLGEKQSEPVYQVSLIGSLPREYASIMEVWELTHESMRTTSNLVSRLLKREEDLKKAGIDDDKAFAARVQRPRMTREEIEAKKKVTNCAICKQRGHWARECPSANQGNDRAKITIEEQANVVTERPRSEDHPDNVNEYEICFNVSSSGDLSDKWVSDSGATSHMCNDKRWFSELNFLAQPDYVKVGDGQRLAITGVGTVKLEALVEDKWIVTRIQGVKYVPGLVLNLISTGQAADKGVSTLYNKDGCVMKMGKETVAVGARLTERLYLMRFRMPTSAGTSSEQALASVEGTMEAYHRKLGHASVDRIKNLLRSLDIKVPESHGVSCEVCPAGKGHRSSHPSIGARATEVGHLHIDLSGRVNKASFAGYQYYLLCKDEISSFVFTYFCKTKSEVPILMQKLVTDFEGLTQTPIKSVHTDNGSEFMNEITALLFAKEKIEHRTSAPYCPQQNGRIEREMRTITEMARTMMLAARLPTEIWPEAVAHAVYIKNRLPMKGSMITPYEKIMGRKPYIGNILEFGAQVHVIINDRYLTKWDARTAEGFAVGCATRSNTYKVFLPQRNRVVTSCDVIVAPHGREIKVQADSRPFEMEVVFVEHGKGEGRSANQNHEVTRTRDDSQTELLELGQPSPAHHTQIDQSQRDASDASSHSLPFKTPLRTMSCSTPKKVVTGSRLDKFFDDFRNEQRGTTETRTGQAEIRSSSSFNDEPIYDEPMVEPRDLPEPSASDEDLTEVTSPSQATVTEGSTEQAHTIRPYRDEFVMIASNMVGENIPANYDDALKSENREEWQAAIKSELEAHKTNGTWDIAPRRGDRRPLTTKWVFTIKRDAEGRILRHKARLVARGFEQRQGIDYDQTFAPVARLDSLRTLVAIAAARDFSILQFDVSTAFLQGVLTETVMIEAPRGLEVPSNSCLKLNKALYGLKQAPRAWNSTFTRALNDLGYQATKMDPCVFTNANRSIFMLIYCDDALVMGQDRQACQSLIDQLATKFTLKQLPGDFFLGIRISKTMGGYELSQTRYAADVTRRFKLEDARAASSPLSDPGLLFEPEGEPARAPYREAIGCLQYLACGTRPDILFAVGFLARFNANPLEKHWQAVKRLIRYVKATSDRKLVYVREQSESVSALAYADADWAGDPEHRYSTTGILIELAGGPVIFASRKQKDVALSSTHAEYYAACDAVCELKWLSQLLSELGIKSKTPILHIDNKSTIFMIENHDTRRRSKHIEVRYHFIKQLCERRVF